MKYCDYYLKLQQFPNSKKNCFRGNYMRKYGMYYVGIENIQKAEFF